MSVIVQTHQWPHIADITDLPWFDHYGFSYSLSMPSKEQWLSETLDVVDEIFPKELSPKGWTGCYDFRNTVRRGESWMDVGCHVGIFSIGVMMHGGYPMAIIDANPEMVKHASWNINHFARTLEMLSDLPESSLRPQIELAEMISDPWQLVALCGTKYDGLKLDIQGSEIPMFLQMNAAKCLTTVFSKLVLEWHDVDTVQALIVRLDRAGWKVNWMREHEDVLLETPTYLIYAST